MENYDLMYRSPLQTNETNLEIAIGSIEFRDKTIKNLRTQIAALRELAEDAMISVEKINSAQYAHLRKNDGS